MCHDLASGSISASVSGTATFEHCLSPTGRCPLASCSKCSFRAADSLPPGKNRSSSHTWDKGLFSVAIRYHRPFQLNALSDCSTAPRNSSFCGGTRRPTPRSGRQHLDRSTSESTADTFWRRSPGPRCECRAPSVRATQTPWPGDDRRGDRRPVRPRAPDKQKTIIVLVNPVA